MSALTLSHFGEFFAAVNEGARPYRWQVELLEQLHAGQWPERVVAPTGTGKSALIEIHVFLRALSVQEGRAFPRRLVLSVGRRALVDAQARRAMNIAAALDSPTTDILRDVAALLRQGALPAGHSDDTSATKPVSVSVMRGGMAVDRSWLDDPLGCQILCVTPDLLGSRLLFRGYLASTDSWPRHAGLLAYDTCVVVDESHLNTQLVTTLRRIREFAAESPLAWHLEPLRVLETTATPPSTGVDSELVVQGNDVSDPSLATRLSAAKTLEIVPVDEWPLPKSGPRRRTGVQQIIDLATRMHGATTGTRGVILNRVRDAVEVAIALGKAGFTVATLVGPMRPYDRQRLETEHPGLLSPRGNEGVDFLVATQTVEVGVDLDLAGLLTEVSPGPSLVQRLGRVNRRGLRDNAPVTVLVPRNLAGTKEARPYERSDIAASVKWLDRIGSGRDLSAASIDAAAVPKVTSRRLLLSRLSRTEAAVLARGQDSLNFTPDLEFWLNDSLDHEQPMVSVVGRTLPEDPQAAVGLIAATPPGPQEMYPSSITTARAVLEHAGSAVAVLVRAGGESQAMKAAYLAHRLAPGDVVVLPATLPAAAEGVLVPPDVEGRKPLGEVHETERDERGRGAGDAEAQVVQRSVVLPTVPATGDAPPAEYSLLAAITRAAEEIEEDGRDFDAVGLYQEIDPQDRPEVTWDEVRSRLSPVATGLMDRYLGRPAGAQEDRFQPVLHLPQVSGPEGVMAWCAVTWRAVEAVDTVEIQEYSPGEQPVLLDQHQRDVAERARAFGDALGLPTHLVQALGEAGQHHDDGKIAGPFQARLNRPQGSPPLAKSGNQAVRNRSVRRRGSLPSGWRHEQLSVAVAWDALAPETRPLAARLIGTSHGRGRVDFPHVTDELITADPHLERYRDRAIELFDRGGWDELVDATDREWGVWGTAFLEAIVRAADTSISAEGK